MTVDESREPSLVAAYAEAKQRAREEWHRDLQAARERYDRAVKEAATRYETARRG
jgi:hypothetical protein